MELRAYPSFTRLFIASMVTAQGIDKKNESRKI
jgi:hypothetical protein